MELIGRDHEMDILKRECRILREWIADHHPPIKLTLDGAQTRAEHDLDDTIPGWDWRGEADTDRE